MKTDSFTLIVTVSLFVASLMATVANAQGKCGGRPCSSPTTWLVSSPHHASTVMESHARGYADLLRAQAQYNLITSQAMLQAAQARRLQLDNRVKQTETFFQLREMNRNARFGERSLAWPQPLNGPEFANYRTVVQEVLARNAAGSSDRSRLNQACRGMDQKLRQQVRLHSAEDYLAAREFLTVLRSSLAPSPR